MKIFDTDAVWAAGGLKWVKAHLDDFYYFCEHSPFGRECDAAGLLCDETAKEVNHVPATELQELVKILGVRMDDAYFSGISFSPFVKSVSCLGEKIGTRKGIPIGEVSFSFRAGYADGNFHREYRHYKFYKVVPDIDYIDSAKVRRRVEDALRKTATEEQLRAIAELLGVKAE